jgi:hypothetical protein
MGDDVLQLDEIVMRIDQAFGAVEPSFFDAPLTGQDFDVLRRVLSGDAYRSYLQDEINRHIIRDYLSNAVLLGYLPQERLAAFDTRASTLEGRSALSLHMLMSSVEEAEQLSRGDHEHLRPLRPAPGAPPHMKLVPR